LQVELDRLRATHRKVVLYEAHSIRSVVPRLFEGELPNFNIGTNSGASCDPALTMAVEQACDASAFSRVTNGRFKGGWTTRRYGQPSAGIHALQMELACRGYMDEPTETPTAATWPAGYDPHRAAPMRAALTQVLEAALAFARS
jgi:N-formylglutamate deformylase